MRSTLRNPLGASAVVATMALAVLGCAADETTTTTADETTAVDETSTTTAVAVNQGAIVEVNTIAGKFVYDPDAQVVEVDQAVTWRNIDSADHTVTADPGQAVEFRSPTIESGTEFVQTFAEPGTYTYFCSIHGRNRMAGTITVEEKS